MQRSDISPKPVHREVKTSTTLNRKYVRRPAPSNTVVSDMVKPRQISHHAPMNIATTSQLIREPEPEVLPNSPFQAKIRAKMQAKTTPQAPPQKLSAKELKDRAIKKALAETLKSTPETPESTPASAPIKTHFGLGRVLLAFSCATAALFAIIYFVNLNMPDLSLRVAAMQTGIEASYPSFVPRGFTLSDIVSKPENITINFKNHTSNESFSLTEEKSTWDSNALLKNYVLPNLGNDYTTIREQGLTVYLSEKGAAWVNGGIVYKLSASSLSKNQITMIATSL